MSTDHQKYSIENQKQAIAEYALLYNLEIVRTYADEGRSGVTIKRRDALKRLLADVQEGNVDFDLILVYDVSRWGRFQDADEAAHYEFLCKNAGISVIYCAELFENNGSLFSALVKVIKRVMAGEYSRELSAKVSRAHRFHASRGFHQGGPRAYGLDRILVDESGRRKAILQQGEQKSFFADRVMLGPGPENEVQVVQEIFRMYARERMSQREIMRTLNQRGIPTRCGNPWSPSNMSKLLANEKYGGTFVYHRSRWTLYGGYLRNTREDSIRLPGAIEAIVPKDIFYEVQRRLAESQPWTDIDLLNYLTAAWCRDGHLSIPSVNRNEFCPKPPTYQKHFGRITEAYRLIGYKRVHVFRYSKISGNMLHVHRATLSQLISSIKSTAVVFDEKEQVLKINGCMTVAVFVLPFLKKCPTPGWKLYLDHVRPCDAVLVVRMEETNVRPLDFHLFPRSFFLKRKNILTEDRSKTLRAYRLRAPSDFEGALMRIRDMLAKQSKSMARLQQDSPEHATAAETASSKRRRKQKKLVPRPATKSENLLVGRLVARAASEIAAGSAVIPKEVVDMIVRGVHPIRAFRVHRHMSQIQLCAAARIAQAHLSGLENARIKPKLPTLKKLAVALNVPSDLLNAVK